MMKKASYLGTLGKILLQVKVNSGKDKQISFDSAILKITDLILNRINEGNKVILIGNGGSASIASHIATDLLKNAQIPAMTFNDSALITCLSNDLGYETVFEKPIEAFSAKGDILFAISSSGKSKNILNAVKKAAAKGCFLITLSGFDNKNPLRKMGGINFYLPSFSYGYVEIAHLAICHCIADILIEKRKYG